jgi:signal transduction histidine kinase
MYEANFTLPFIHIKTPETISLMNLTLNSQPGVVYFPLRLKTLFVVALILIVLLLLLYFSSYAIVMNGFTQIENEAMRQNMERAVNALWDEISVIYTTTRDWAHWDDTYNFLLDKNITYTNSNTMDGTFANNDINFMVYIRSSGTIIYSKGYDLYSKHSVSIPGSLLSYLSPENPLLNHNKGNRELNIDGLSGLLLLPEAPLLIASVPVLTGEMEGPSPGSLIWGRYLDAPLVERLAEETRLSITIHPVDSAALPQDFITAIAGLSDESIFVQPLDRHSVAGYTVLKDIYGNSAVLLRVQMPRTIYKQGLASLSYFIIALLVIGLVLGGVILLLLEKMILSRLANLSMSVTQVQNSGDLSIPIVVSGHDELSDLAVGIQGMLASLATSQKRLQSSHDELERRVETRTAELSEMNTLLRQEITEHKQTQIQLAQARDQALEALRLKTQILANVSHDARTPLSTLMLRTELFQRGRYGQITEEQNKALDIILLSARQLLAFLNNLLAEAQLNHQKVRALNIKFAMSNLLQEVYEAMLPLAEKKGLQLRTEMEDGFPILIQSDPERLRQILTNLIDNAIKFTDHGTITISLYRSDPDHWAFAIRDTGRGISKEAFSDIFKAFWQVDGSMTREVNRGVGLGLSIVKQLTTLLGGEVTVQSELGSGTLFTVILPLSEIKEGFSE